MQFFIFVDLFGSLNQYNFYNIVLFFLLLNNDYLSDINIDLISF